jgi:2-succinyl-5-enolpyruvyl-6-hydroxy-3-cyclohexene-1-carboxylate synthase
MFEEIIRELSGKIPSHWNVFCGNSSAIRLWDECAQRVDVPYSFYANRGASGIDGLISTACGVAMATRNPTLLILGDLSFFHDMTGLDWVRRSDVPVVVVILNNNGGAIFKELDMVVSEDIFEQCFITPTHLHFKGICEMMRIRYDVGLPDIGEIFQDPFSRVIELLEEK